MADECTDITAVEELSVFCHCQMLFGLCAFNESRCNNIHLALLRCIKDKNLQVSNTVEMGFDGAANFSGKKEWCTKD